MNDEPESDTMDTDYVLSSGDPDPDTPHGTDWPKELRISFDAREIRLWQGKGHGLGGASYGFDEFDLSEWEAFLHDCDAEWLVELLSPRGSLADLSETEFLEAVTERGTLVTENH
ncbi:hypothetical protein [Natrinema salaciae]|uniref:Uncharacterized protein n=1 Tax=Natrinema salaciae TaxID=1186196 RepID=A0A1H9GMW6_9EURY|nr:hypothetical protein [Natrinema salaciae]SEQ51379.1 hypothetical protein SAMN04489841_1936 [Natrinema salaciae]